MFETDAQVAAPVAAEENHIPSDEDATLRQNAPATHEHPGDSGRAPWLFIGGLSMPGSEHLIPLLN